MPLLIKKREYSFNYMVARLPDETPVGYDFKGYLLTLFSMKIFELFPPY